MEKYVHHATQPYGLDILGRDRQELAKRFVKLCSNQLIDWRVAGVFRCPSLSERCFGWFVDRLGSRVFKATGVGLVWTGGIARSDQPWAHIVIGMRTVSADLGISEDMLRETWASVGGGELHLLPVTPHERLDELRCVIEVVLGTGGKIGTSLPPTNDAFGKGARPISGWQRKSAEIFAQRDAKSAAGVLTDDITHE